MRLNLDTKRKNDSVMDSVFITQMPCRCFLVSFVDTDEKEIHSQKLDKDAERASSRPNFNRPRALDADWLGQMQRGRHEETGQQTNEGSGSDFTTSHESLLF